MNVELIKFLNFRIEALEEQVDVLTKENKLLIDNAHAIILENQELLNFINDND